MVAVGFNPRTSNPKPFFSRVATIETMANTYTSFPKMKGCAWQDGYGALTVSKSDIPSVVAYIQGQREHHRVKSFQEEYRELLKRHEIEFDERYVWG